MAQRSEAVAAATRKAYPKRKPVARLADYNGNAPTSQAYPGQRPFNDPWMNALVNDGIQFWAKRNVTMPKSVAVNIADDLETISSQPHGVAGVGWSAQTTNDGLARIAMRRDYINGLLETARDKTYDTKSRRTALKKLATVVYHELGHVGGVGHSADGKGLMSAELDTVNPQDYSTIPYSSALLIRKLIPKRTVRRGKRSLKVEG